MELSLPPEIRMPRREVVATYLGRHPDTVSVVASLAAALVREFEHEPAQIELDQYDDPEIDDHYLTFWVRLPAYDEAFMERLDKVSRTADDPLATSTGYVLITSDFRGLVDDDFPGVLQRGVAARHRHRQR